MVRRTRDIQKKIWLTPQEERTIAKKMEMIGTENFGAYARKMLIDGYIIVVDYTEQKKLAAEINKIGVNINTVWAFDSGDIFKQFPVKQLMFICQKSQ